MLNLEDIVKRYKPVLYLYSGEKYYPCEIEKYLENCELFYKNIKVLEIGEVNEKTLVRDTLRDGKPVENAKYWNLRTRFKNKNSQISEINDIPIYSKAKIIIENNIAYYEITYIFFYAYRGPYRIFNIKFGNYCPADFEHITMRIDKDGNLNSIYYGKHGYFWGDWRYIDEIERTPDGRPIIYIAKSSHANYSKPGTHFRIFFLANDKTDKGIKWDPNNIIDITEKSYAKYRGLWSIIRGMMKGSPGLPNRRWWYCENNISAKWYEILFTPCLLGK